MDNKKCTKSMKELQDDIATMRKDGPQYYSELLKKEFAAVQRNLANADFKGIDIPKEDLKKINQSYIFENLQENVTQNEKLIQLNAKCDSLAQCMEFMKD